MRRTMKLAAGNSHHASVLIALTVEILPLSLLNPALYNPRKSLKPGDIQYDMLKRSIQEFGLVDPLFGTGGRGILLVVISVCRC